MEILVQVVNLPDVFILSEETTQKPWAKKKKDTAGDQRVPAVKYTAREKLVSRRPNLLFGLKYQHVSYTT